MAYRGKLKTAFASQSQMRVLFDDKNRFMKLHKVDGGIAVTVSGDFVIPIDDVEVVVEQLRIIEALTPEELQ